MWSMSVGSRGFVIRSVVFFLFAFLFDLLACSVLVFFLVLFILIWWRAVFFVISIVCCVYGDMVRRFVLLVCVSS